MPEPREIEPYYRHQGKQLVDVFFDKGLLSDTLSRDGMDAIEGMLAFYLQSASDTAARVATLTKKYKVLPGGAKGEPGHERHEEEMRWIARAREAEGRVKELEGLSKGTDFRIKIAEARVAELEAYFPKEEKAIPAWQWGREVCDLLRKALEPPFGLTGRESFVNASRLFTDAITLGIIPEPDCGPGSIQTEPYPPGGFILCQHSKASFPGALITKCPECGGNRI